MRRFVVATLRGRIRTTSKKSARAKAKARHPSSAVAPSFASAHDLVAFELSRGRRYERPFTLVFVPAVATDGRSDTDEFVQSLRCTIREGDHLWVDPSGVLMLLPESRAVGAAAFTRRLALSMDLDRADIRHATFPSDGVTRGALFSILAGNRTHLPDSADLPWLPSDPDLSAEYSAS